MALQILSDLHLEVFDSYDDFEVTPAAPYLALLGDIGNVEKHKDKLFDFLLKQMSQFEAVLFVPGNHEAYHGSWADTYTALLAFEKQQASNTSLGKFIMLDCKSFDIPHTNTTVLGCSLFSHIPDSKAMTVEMQMNDFMTTKEWTSAKHNAAHTRDLEWLNQTVQDSAHQNRDIIILTHWSPTTDERAVDPRHTDSVIGCAFSTDLHDQSCFTNEHVKVWAFGHTHYNCDFEVDRATRPLRVLTNQYGYYSAQAAGFDPTKAIP